MVNPEVVFVLSGQVPQKDTEPFAHFDNQWAIGCVVKLSPDSVGCVCDINMVQEFTVIVINGEAS